MPPIDWKVRCNKLNRDPVEEYYQSLVADPRDKQTQQFLGEIKFRDLDDYHGCGRCSSATMRCCTCKGDPVCEICVYKLERKAGYEKYGVSCTCLFCTAHSRIMPQYILKTMVRVVHPALPRLFAVRGADLESRSITYRHRDRIIYTR